MMTLYFLTPRVFSNQKFMKLLERSVHDPILDKSGQTAYILALHTENVQQRLDYCWKAICKGYPGAAPFFITLIKEMGNDLDDKLDQLTSKSESLDQSADFKSLFFRFIFAIQKTINLNYKFGYSYEADRNSAFEKLSTYILRFDTEVAVVAVAALVLASLELRGKEKFHIKLFENATKNPTIFREYIDFAVKQGHLLHPEDRRILSPFFAPADGKSTEVVSKKIS